MIKKFIPIALMLFVFSSCSDLQVLTSYDDDADFTSFKTFGVINYDTNSVVSGRPTGFADGYFKMSIEKQMKERGYKISDVHDLEVYYYLKLNTSVETVVNSSPHYGGYYGSPNYYGYYGGYGYGSIGIGYGGSTSVSQVDHTEGTLIIDIVDVKGNKVIWQGTAKKGVDGKGSVQREIDYVIDKIFADFKWVVGDAAEGKKKK